MSCRIRFCACFLKQVCAVKHKRNSGRNITFCTMVLKHGRSFFWSPAPPGLHQFMEHFIRNFTFFFDINIISVNLLKKFESWLPNPLTSGNYVFKMDTNKCEINLWYLRACQCIRGWICIHMSPCLCLSQSGTLYFILATPFLLFHSG